MVSEQTTSWEDVLGRSAAEFARDAEDVRRRFWAKAKRFAAGLPFAEDLVTAYYCAFDHETPVQVKAALAGTRLCRRCGRAGDRDPHGRDAYPSRASRCGARRARARDARG